MKNPLNALLSLIGLGPPLIAKDIVLKEGECWRYSTRPGDEASFLVIRKVETLPKLGEVVFITVLGVKMKGPPVPAGVLATAAGCSTKGLRDERLIGTWRSNGEQTIAQMFAHDPRWTNAPPEKVQKLRAMFGSMTITYGDGTIVTRFNGENEKLAYGVIERGADYVVIRIKGGLEDGQKERLRYADDAKAYWIHSFAVPNIEERFDKVITEPNGAANGSQPIRSETNSTSPAAGSRR